MSQSVLIVPLSVFFQMKKLARRQQQQQEQQNSQRLGQGTVSQNEPHCKLVCLRKKKKSKCKCFRICATSLGK